MLLINQLRMSHTRKIGSIYNSRKTILELLQSQLYKTDDYTSFSINEVDAMYKTNQLDMLLEHETNGQKVYVKYHLPIKQKQIQKNVLDDIVEDLFVLENVLTKRDTLIIIMDDEPNESSLTRITYLYEKEDIFVVIHNLKRLQFNILKHILVPKITIMTDEETETFMREKNVQTLSQLPEISRFDPQALAVCMRPKQVCRFERISPTALQYAYYRVCV